MSDELKCPVCTELCTRPRDCLACGRLFCTACIAQLKSCPLCRKEPFITHYNSFASHLLDNVRVKCVLCGVLVERPHFEQHKTTCEARVRQCSFRGCEFVATNKTEAIDHFSKKHMDEMWTNMEHLSTIVAPGILV